MGLELNSFCGGMMVAVIDIVGSREQLAAIHKVIDQHKDLVEDTSEISELDAQRALNFGLVEVTAVFVFITVLLKAAKASADLLTATTKLLIEIRNLLKKTGGSVEVANAQAPGQKLKLDGNTSDAALKQFAAQ